VDSGASGRDGGDRQARARARVHRLLAQAAGRQAHDAVAALPEAAVAALLDDLLAGETDLDAAAGALLSRLPADDTSN
jgi:hypothetical protein